MAQYFVITLEPGSGNYRAVNGPNVNKTFDAVDGPDANGIAALQEQSDGKYVAFSVGGELAAVLITPLIPDNSNLQYTADTLGPSGNNIRVRYVVAGNNTALSVSVASNDITVNVATNGSGVATSTAAQVRTAVNAHGTAGGMVTVEFAPSNDGTGVVEAMDYQTLVGGTTGAAVASFVDVVAAVDVQPTTF